jgi:hypothetical protein
MLSMHLCIPQINFRMPEPAFMKFGLYRPVCLYMYLTIVARQGLSKNITAAMNTHATIREEPP